MVGEIELMNYFELSIVGCTELPHREIEQRLEYLIETINQQLEGDVKLAYFPTDEYGNVLKEY